MCVAIKHNIADEDIFQDLLRDRVIALYRLFRQYIEYTRQKRGSSHVFENLEYYAKKWEKNPIYIAGKRLTDV